jgi:hypothetical protein
MNWISIKNKLPDPVDNNIIVAIMNSCVECGEDPIEDAEIALLRYSSSWREWRSLDSVRPYDLPDNEYGNDHYSTIQYWVPWQEFPFPDSMIVNQPDRSKREDL